MDIITLLKSECKKAGTQAAWAKDHGLSAAYVTDVLLGKRNAGAKILSALGVEKVVTHKFRGKK